MPLGSIVCHSYESKKLKKQTFNIQIIKYEYSFKIIYIIQTFWHHLTQSDIIKAGGNYSLAINNTQKFMTLHLGCHNIRFCQHHYCGQKDSQ